MVLHGVALATAAGHPAAIILELAHPARITPLLMSVYGLTEREQEVTRLVLEGNSTSEIAAQLFISPHTVQEHLKHIFEKTGVRSRRDLVGKVSFAHYEPRVRDNEPESVGWPTTARRPHAWRGAPRKRLAPASLMYLPCRRCVGSRPRCSSRSVSGRGDELAGQGSACSRGLCRPSDTEQVFVSSS